MPTPDPPTTSLRSRADRAPVGADRAEEGSPAAPAIPSFASLRAPRGRSAIDVLLPGGPPPPLTPPPPPPPSASSSPPPPSAPSSPSPSPVDARSAGPAPRPAEYADLLRLGVHVARSVAGVPWHVAGWALRAPATCLRRLLGG